MLNPTTLPAKGNHQAKKKLFYTRSNCPKNSKSPTYTPLSPERLILCNVPPSPDPCRVSNMAVVWDLNVVYDPPLLWPGAPILLPTLTYHSQDFSGFRPMADKKTCSWNLTNPAQRAYRTLSTTACPLPLAKQSLLIAERLTPAWVPLTFPR